MSPKLTSDLGGAIREMRVIPKFYANWPDDWHCLQAAVRMVLNSLVREFSWAQVNALTEYSDRLYSWTVNGASALARFIPGTKLVGIIDYAAFASLGEEHFREVNASDPGWFELQKRFASPGFVREQSAAAWLVGRGVTETRIPTLQELEAALGSSWLVALVDSRKMAGEPGNVAHFVLIYDQTPECFFVHDPGLPARSSWGVPKPSLMGAFKNEVIIVPNQHVGESAQVNAKIGRNDPCPCGSGKKYKKCCGKAV